MGDKPSAPPQATGLTPMGSFHPHLPVTLGLPAQVEGSGTEPHTSYSEGISDPKYLGSDSGKQQEGKEGLRWLELQKT